VQAGTELDIKGGGFGAASGEPMNSTPIGVLVSVAASFVVARKMTRPI